MPHPPSLFRSKGSGQKLSTSKHMGTILIDRLLTGSRPRQCGSRKGINVCISSRGSSRSREAWSCWDLLSSKSWLHYLVQQLLLLQQPEDRRRRQSASCCADCKQADWLRGCWWWLTHTMSGEGIIFLNHHRGEVALLGTGTRGEGERVKTGDRRQTGRPRIPWTAARTTKC